VSKVTSLISPVTGQVIKIKKVIAKLSTSADAFQELKHVEEQIVGMTVMPDFGYGQDNYILQKEESSSKNNWLLLSELLNNPEKFSWLMNYIKLKGL
jgi:hypothetical protein